MSKNPLYNEVSEYVRNALNSRGSAYGRLLRGDKQGINFPYKKTSFLRIDALDNEDKVVLSLGSPKKGGFTALYNTSNRNLPGRAILKEASISNQGEMGSLQKANFSFTVFTPEQLSYYESKLMSPGTNIRISYGWSVGAFGGSPTKADADSLIGIVYNFSYDVQSDGSFNCSVEVVSKGFYAGAVSSEANLQSDEEPTQDEQGNAIYASNLKKFIEKNIKERGDQIPVFNAKSLDGIDFHAIELKYDPEQEKPAEDEEVKVESKKFYYLSINSLVDYFNRKVLSQIPRYEQQNIRYSSDLEFQLLQSDGKDEVISDSAYYKDLVSSSPDEILFSDEKNAKYGDVSLYLDTARFKYDETTVNLGEILISTDTIIKIYDKLAEEKEDEPAHKSITAFFSEIFTKISYCSGGVYQLSIVVDEDSEANDRKTFSDTPTRLVVVDKNYTGQNEIKPYTFRRTINRSIIRDMSLSSTLPNEAAVQMYSGGRTGMTAGRGGNAKTLIEDSPAGEDAQEQEVDEVEKALNQLSDAKKAMGVQGSTFTTRSNLRSALTQYKSNPPEYAGGNGGWIDKTLYPLNLSLTIDGIAGLRFGNVIRTDWLPAKYKKLGQRIVFVITKVDHTISDNQWTTQIETQCRLEK